ncbi:MAG: hypothetical protein Q9221_002233 [Calogaya cf. arnoldii]
MAFHRFLDLPMELRQQIYISYMDALPLTYPDLLPPLLFSAPELSAEACYIWRRYWPRTQLRFNDTRQLVDFNPHSDHIHITEIFDFHKILPLFPGLQLSTLTLYDPFRGYQGSTDCRTRAYRDLDHLSASQGWKELIYLVHGDRLPEPDPNRVRFPHPRTWDDRLKKRDGYNSGASVQFIGIDVASRRTPTIFEPPIDVWNNNPRAEQPRPEQIEVRFTRGHDAAYVQESGKCNDLVDSWKNLNNGRRLHSSIKLDWIENQFRRLAMSES